MNVWTAACAATFMIFRTFIIFLELLLFHELFQKAITDFYIFISLPQCNCVLQSQAEYK